MCRSPNSSANHGIADGTRSVPATFVGHVNRVVNMFGNDHESETQSVVLGPYRFEMMNHNPFASILIQQLPTSRTREREKVCMTGIIEDATTHGGDSLFGGNPTSRHVSFFRVARLASSRVRQHKKYWMDVLWNGTLVLVQRSC